MKPFALLLAAALLAGALSAAVPQTIVYQGRITDDAGAPVTDGLYLIQFRIYDAPVDGTTLWDNNYRTVLVTDGLFEYHLGDSTALPNNLFEDTGRWLGMKVGAEPEMSPRIPLASYAYAYHALRADTAQCALEVAGDPYVNETGDTMTGTLNFYESGGNQRVARLTVDDAGNFANLELYDADVSTTLPISKLWGNDYGTLVLHNPDGHMTATLNATDTEGGRMYLSTVSGQLAIGLEGGRTGDASATFPESAINENEILNEPGLAAQYTFQVDLTSATDLVVDSVEVTTPTSGYLLVIGSGIFYRIHTSGSGYTALRASVGDTRSVDLDNGAIWTVASTWPTETYYSPFSVHAIVPVAAGTREVFLVADAHQGSGVLVRAHLTTLFFPTAYGTIESVKSSGLDPGTIDGSDLPAPETYDARPLIEAERAAQLEQQRLETEAQSREERRNEDRD